MPAALASAPVTIQAGEFIRTGTLINLPAVLVVAFVAGVGYVSITQSAFVNSVVVAIKGTVIVLFIALGARYIDPGNWPPFIPPNEGPGRFGVDGVVRAAAIVFFAYIGFDAVSTAAGEARNPQRAMPVGILGSL